MTIHFKIPWLVIGGIASFAQGMVLWWMQDEYPGLIWLVTLTTAVIIVSVGKEAEQETLKKCKEAK